MNSKTTRRVYVAPAIEVIEVENEGVMALSGDVSAPGMGNGGSMFSTGGTRSPKSNVHQTSTPFSELEDILNDLLTIKK